ncbi:MAG TPA: TetR/AcrR family transcriptional regulator [Bacteroidales bacterium]|jgi:AcrR family transcriptional regulator|nr:TetR/AcrR family transcriptional regulator [Bacteroidales bacterium]HNT93046.1 TetR/AcrR family transcriptional regulator [Bacteroidales bacterium]
MTKRGTREMIVDVAAGLFATVGLRRTTMETIAAAAGRGRRTLYMYFKNKAEIYDAVVDMEIKKITGPLSNLARSDEPLSVILVLYGEERARRLNDLASRNPLLLRDFAQGHSRIERLREKLHRLEIKMLKPLFKRNATGSSAPGNPSPEDYASLYLSLLRGNDRLLTKTDGLHEAIRLSSLSAWLLLRALETDYPGSVPEPESHPRKTVS